MAFKSQCEPTGLGEIILPIQIENQITVRRKKHVFISICRLKNEIFQTSSSLNIKVEQLSSVSRQWNIENLSPLSKIDEIRFGENLSILFKCFHRDQHVHHGTLAIKNVSFDKEKHEKVRQF